MLGDGVGQAQIISLDSLSRDVHNHQIDIERLEKAFVKLVDKNMKMAEGVAELAKLLQLMNEKVEKLENVN